MIEKSDRAIDLEVDGGVNQTNARSIVQAGGNVLIAGTAIFKADNIEEAILSMRANAESANQ